MTTSLQAVTSIPHGLMCCECIKKQDNCSQLGFDKMPPILDYKDGYKAVRCKAFERENVDD
jgi:hypothetical protein